MRRTGAKWLALGLAVVGVVVLCLVAASEIDGGPLLIIAVGAAILVLLLPVAAYFIFSRSRPTDDGTTLARADSSTSGGLREPGRGSPE